MKTSFWVIFISLLFSFSSFPEPTDGLLIQGIHYATHQGISVGFENGKITEVTALQNPNAAPKYFIAPGLIDVQINGFVGVDFSGPDLTVEKVKKVTKALWAQGVTSYFPTVITQDISRLKTNLAILAKAKQDPEIGQSIPGFHLEGPYISPTKGFRGAHLEKYIKAPDWEEFMALQKAANHHIKLITLAPEWDGAIPFIKKCVQQGIVVALGHHNGSVTDIQNAVKAGARMATHLGNGCSNQIHRHHNPIWPQLSEDLITPSIIADGHHLTREEIRSFYKVKGPDNMLLVSDALDLAGLPPGEYIRGERKLLLTSEVVKFPEENVLAGAASPISRCIEVMMEFTQCSLEEAIRMTSTNPARIFGLSELGGIDAGKKGNLIVFELSDGKIKIQKTFVEGKRVFAKQP